jgi:hypothetical protein
MTGKRRSGDRAKSSARARTGKPRLKKETLKDLDAKGGDKIRGGTFNFYSGYCGVGPKAPPPPTGGYTVTCPGYNTQYCFKY